MYISMNWIQEFVDLSGIDLMALIHQFSLSTAEVENEIFLKAEDVDYSTLAEETIPCDYSGDNLIMGFNKTRIIEVLDNINNDTVSILLSASSRAGIFAPEKQEEGEDLLVLLMPMMI